VSCWLSFERTTACKAFVRLVRPMAHQLHLHRSMSLTIPEHARHPVSFPLSKSYGVSRSILSAHLGSNFGLAISSSTSKHQDGMRPYPLTRSMS
jgi:hypothetical protein